MPSIQECIEQYNGEWPETGNPFIIYDKSTDSYRATKNCSNREFMIDKVKFKAEASKLGYKGCNGWQPEPYEICSKGNGTVTFIGFLSNGHCVYEKENRRLSICHPSWLKPIEHYKIKQYLKECGLDYEDTKAIHQVQVMIDRGDLKL